MTPDSLLLSTEPLSIVVSGYYGFGNTGDEAVLAGIVDSLRAMTASARITAFSATPDATSAQHRIQAVDRNNWRLMSNYIKECDLLISGGGSLLQDVTSALSPLYYLNIIRLGLRARKPVMLYAQGFGPLNRPLNRAVARRLLNRVSAITVRDEDSSHELKRLGVTIPIEVTADPAFMLRASNPQATQSLMQEMGLGEKGQPLVGVSLRPWPGMESRRVQLREGLQRLADATHCRFVFLPMHEPGDRMSADSLVHDLQAATLPERSLGPREILGVVGQYDLMVAMRLHALIFAAAQQVPLVGIGYDPKVTSFCKWLDQPTMDWSQIGEGFGATLMEAWESRERLKATLHGRSESLRTSAMRNAEVAMQLAITARA